MESTAEALTEKIRSLTPEQLSQVEQLIASLRAEHPYRAALSLSEAAFGRVWTNSEDDVYGAL